MKILRTFLIFSIVSSSAVLTKAGAAWFQICDHDRKHSISSKNCKLGLWMTEPMQARCVCLKGVWVVTEDLCDSDVMILVGNGNCFALKKPIRSIKLLGQAQDPFAPATYIADENFDTFTKVPGNRYNKKLGSTSSIVVSIFPLNTLIRSDHHTCIFDENPQENAVVFIWKNDRRVTSRFRYVDKSECTSIIPYHLQLAFGEAYQDSKVLRRESMELDCSRDCRLAYSEDENPKGLKNRKVQMSDNIPVNSPTTNTTLATTVSPEPKKGQRGIEPEAITIPPLTIKSKTRRPKPPCDRTPQKIQPKFNPVNPSYLIEPSLDFMGGETLNKTKKEEKQNWYKFRWNMSLNSAAYSREIREQSLRMIQAQTNFFLMNIPPPKLDVAAYDYFQKFRQIFLVIVPNDVISHDVVNGLTRMFRLLLWEAHDKFEHQESPNLLQHERIMEKLNACLANVSEYPFAFIDRVNPDESALPRAHSTHACLEKTVEVYWNDTEKDDSNKVRFGHTDKDLCDLSGSRRQDFEFANYDLVIELAWKMYLIGFYRCYDFFEGQATDAHELAYKVESLFNYRVIKRWYYPHDFLKALQVIFPNLNPKIFAWAVDKMLVGSRESSDWSTVLNRPPIPITEDDMPRRRKRGEKKRKFKPQLWHNTAFCMSTFWDPIEKFEYGGKSGCYIPTLTA